MSTTQKTVVPTGLLTASFVPAGRGDSSDVVQLQPCTEGGGQGRRLAVRHILHRQHDKGGLHEGERRARRCLFQLRHERLREGGKVRGERSRNRLPYLSC